jgi:hypothetical protein
MTTTKITSAAATTEANAKNHRNQTGEFRTPSIAPEWEKVKHYDEIGQLILPQLRSGRGSARKRVDLVDAVGLPDRTFRRGIESLRRAGVVICAGDGGYYLPATVAEVEGYIAQEEARARSTFFTLQSARRLAEAMQAEGEQLTIGGEGM